MSKIKGSEPINPTGFSQSGTGLTIREYFAAMAMQGLMMTGAGAETIAADAVACADALIAELNKEPV